AHQLIQGAAYSYRGFVKSYKDSKDSPQVTVPLKAFSSDHGSPEERFYNLVCMAYGYDPKEFADLVDKGYLPESRAKGCYFEYRDVAYAFHQVVSPHIDAAKARKVLDTRWFADADIKGPASR